MEQLIYNGGVHNMISLAVCIFTLVCMWMIYEKLGIAGWKCLIPFYNTYVLFKRVYKVSAFWVCLAAEVILFIGTGWITATAIGGMFTMFDIPALYGGVTLANVLIPTVLIIASAIVITVYTIIQYVKLSQAFGTGGAFAAGLVLLTPIFLGIMAFDTRIQPKDNVREDGAAENDYPGDGSNEVYVQPAEEVKAEKTADTEFEKAAVTEPVAAPGNKICPYCRAEIAEDAEKCPFCRSGF